MTNWDHRRCRCVVLPAKPTKKEEAMTEFDPSKPVMTMGGSPVTILKTDLNNAPEILGFVIAADGTEVVRRWHKNGRFHPFFHDDDANLVNIPESKWMNLYDGPEADRIASCWRESRASADGVAELRAKDSAAKRVAIVEWTASGEFITTAVEK